MPLSTNGRSVVALLLLRLGAGLHGQGRKAMATKCLSHELAARLLPGVGEVLVKPRRASMVPSTCGAIRCAVVVPALVSW